MRNLFRFPFVHCLIIIFISTGISSCETNPSANTAVNENSDSLQTAHLLSQKIFFVLHEIEENAPSVKKALLNDGTLNRIYKDKKEALSKAVKDCENMDCLVKALVVSDEENKEILSALSLFYHENDKMEAFMRNQIRPSHAYEFYANYSDSALFIEAWKEQVKGFNYIFHAYMQNKGFHYARIDSSLFKVNSPEYLQKVKVLVSQSLEDKPELFFQPLESVSIKLLQLNGRDEAVRFLPLSGVNGDAYSRIPGTDWKDYPYSGILVLGEGPEDPKQNISAGSKMRARMGAALFREKKAPFIVVSGGYVHPIHTPYCEAEEMKKFLMDSLNIPADVIIMEPHARHTTTNLRNTNRIFLSNGVPRAKPVLVVSAKSHINYVSSNRFPRVFIRDIGYTAYSGLRRLSDTTASYYPTMSSFQINTQEPLDP